MAALAGSRLAGFGDPRHRRCSVSGLAARMSSRREGIVAAAHRFAAGDMGMALERVGDHVGCGTVALSWRNLSDANGAVSRPRILLLGSRRTRLLQEQGPLAGAGVGRAMELLAVPGSPAGRRALCRTRCAARRITSEFGGDADADLGS